MTAVTQALFLTVVSFLFVHELDAVRQREWRFFVAPVPVSDELGYRLFTTLHVPLVVLILWYVASLPFQVGFDAFAIVHGLLHVGLREHPLLQFESRFSWVWILGGSSLGALHLLLVL
ncbi:hypothetical protein N0B31_04760 [Salinirubellus salinus]|uniref:Uncharacterized protein n=1 Tax=Salinirubellus salinus TaxID=1364945 RepID=A0A9E7R5I8_9EURY|nr:DUF6713 family protein [Salinirubellus salinus]UWM55599.1 hypothetical protein N0B31_04760 [Salinirubellus salinus]